MSSDRASLTVYYDAACPRCVADRERYERLAGKQAAAVSWVDVNAQPDLLRGKGIEPHEALRALHVEDARGNIHRELDAYAVLMDPVPALRPLGWLLRLPGVRTVLARIYRWSVLRRLQRQGRA
jgi:predicted DCC family thiol-disulfide oxidoreductase YuxK